MSSSYSEETKNLKNFIILSKSKKFSATDGSKRTEENPGEMEKKKQLDNPLLERVVQLLEFHEVRRVGKGLKNLGNTCFMNSTLQCLTYIPPLFQLALTKEHSNQCLATSFCVFCCLEKHVNQVLISPQSFAPYSFAKSLKLICKSFLLGRQEDAHEFLTNVLDGLHKAAIKGIEKAPTNEQERKSIIFQIFGGHLQSQVKCALCSYESNKVDPFMDLSLDIHGCSTLEKALQKFCSIEVLDTDNKYKCEHCKKLSKAKKQITILHSPNVLSIQLKRFKDFFGGKINKPVFFEEKLTINPYISKNSSQKGEQLDYKLWGVVVHHGGSARFGHYNSYIRNSNNAWYCMDDESVSQTGLQSVLKQQAYLLFYVRDASKIKKPSTTLKDLPKLPPVIEKKDTPILQKSPQPVTNTPVVITEPTQKKRKGEETVEKLVKKPKIEPGQLPLKKEEGKTAVESSKTVAMNGLSTRKGQTNVANGLPAQNEKVKNVEGPQKSIKLNGHAPELNSKSIVVQAEKKLQKISQNSKQKANDLSGSEGSEFAEQNGVDSEIIDDGQNVQSVQDVQNGTSEHKKKKRRRKRKAPTETSDTIVAETPQDEFSVAAVDETTGNDGDGYLADGPSEANADTYTNEQVGEDQSYDNTSFADVEANHTEQYIEEENGDDTWNEPKKGEKNRNGKTKKKKKVVSIAPPQLDIEPSTEMNGHTQEESQMNGHSQQGEDNNGYQAEGESIGDGLNGQSDANSGAQDTDDQASVDSSLFDLPVGQWDQVDGSEREKLIEKPAPFKKRSRYDIVFDLPKDPKYKKGWGDDDGYGKPKGKGYGFGKNGRNPFQKFQNRMRYDKENLVMERAGKRSGFRQENKLTKSFAKFRMKAKNYGSK